MSHIYDICNHINDKLNHLPYSLLFLDPRCDQLDLRESQLRKRHGAF